MSPTWADRRDLGYAVLLAGTGEAELVLGDRYAGRPVWPGPFWLDIGLIVAMTLPVAWRRRRPLTSASTVFGIGTVSTLLLGAPEAATSFVLLIVTTFAGAAYSRRWPVVLAGALVECAAHAAGSPSAQGPTDLFWVFGLAGISLVLGRSLHARQHRIVELEVDARGAADRHAEQVAIATAAERAAIAREIHDLVSHVVSVIVIQAQAGMRALPHGVDTASTALRDIESSARTAMTELRRLLIVLDDGEPAATRPTMSLAELPDLLARCRSAGLQVEADLPAMLPTVPGSTDAVAFHVVREALTNTMRHAPGARVHLAIAEHDDALEVCVADTGPAAQVEPGATSGSGRGLIGMRERVDLVGGRLDAGPDGTGFRVRSRFPLARGST